MFVKVKELMKDILGLVLEICRLYFFVVIVLVLYGGIGLFDIIVFDATYTDEDIHFFVLLLVGAFIFNTIGIVISHWINKNREANLTVEELEKIHVVVKERSKVVNSYIENAQFIIKDMYGKENKIIFPDNKDIIIWDYYKLYKYVVFGYYFVEKNDELERHEYVYRSIKSWGYELENDGVIVYQDTETYNKYLREILLARGIDIEDK